MKTSTVVTFGLYALPIQQDSAFSANSLQPFSNLLDLKTGATELNPYVTYEQNYWLLNGNYKFLPSSYSNVHIGYVSTYMSGATGVFSELPVLTINFGSVHNTMGLTLHFASYTNDFATEIRIKFYNASDSLISENVYHPASVNFSTGLAVENFKKIIIIFYSTNNPYRYLRLATLDYGTLVSFTGVSIKSANVVKEISPLSIELPFSTLDLDLFSPDANFNIIDPAGDYILLQYKQRLNVYEMFELNKVFIGQFFLENWENKSPTEIRFRAIDAIGILETNPFVGAFYQGEVAGDVIQTIMDKISVPVEIDPYFFVDITLNQLVGWIPSGSYRDALQQIAFSIGATVSCSQSGILKISPAVLLDNWGTGDETDYAFTVADKGIEQSVELKALVTGVEIMSHSWSEDTVVKELFNDYLVAGLHTIVFNSPMHDLSVSGATIDSSSASYAILNVSVSGIVILSGQGWIDTVSQIGIYNEMFDVSVKPNIIKISDVKLINSDIVWNVADRVYIYYQQRYLQKMKTYSTEINVNETALVDTFQNSQIVGLIEKVSLDLTDGFIANMEIVGVVAP